MDCPMRTRRSQTWLTQSVTMKPGLQSLSIQLSFPLYSHPEIREGTQCRGGGISGRERVHLPGAVQQEGYWLLRLPVRSPLKCWH
ncbi:hypothetical protein FKM82_026303 [Ascaphus truei]